MVHYISKDALVAEIEKRIKEISKECEESKTIQFTLIGKINALENLLPFLNTLEVKEVDLEKELEYNDYMNFFKEHPDYSNRDWGFDECWVFAKHFFKLGLKAKR